MFGDRNIDHKAKGEMTAPDNKLLADYFAKTLTTDSENIAQRKQLLATKNYMTRVISFCIYFNTTVSQCYR